MQMKALPFLEPSDGTDLQTMSHSRIPEASIKLLCVPQISHFDHVMGPNGFPSN